MAIQTILPLRPVSDKIQPTHFGAHRHDQLFTFKTDIYSNILAGKLAYVTSSVHRRCINSFASCSSKACNAYFFAEQTEQSILLRHSAERKRVTAVGQLARPEQVVFSLAVTRCLVRHGQPSRPPTRSLPCVSYC